MLRSILRPNLWLRGSGTRSSMRLLTTSRSSSSVPAWASLDPHQLGVDTNPYHVSNCVAGQWNPTTRSHIVIPHPLDKQAPAIFTIPDTQIDEVQPYIESLRACPKSGLHNPLKNPERYIQWGEISRKVTQCTVPWCPWCLVVMCDNPSN